MDMKQYDSAPHESALLRANAVVLKTRDRATALAAEISAQTAHGKLIARAAAGDDPDESEWQASEDNLGRLGRVAWRFAAILGLQAKIIEAVRAANDVTVSGDAYVAVSGGEAEVKN